MDDRADFYSVCFDAAGWFLGEKVKEGCTKSVAYFQRPELAEGYQSWLIPPGFVVRVTVEFVPESEVEP